MARWKKISFMVLSLSIGGVIVWGGYHVFSPCCSPFSRSHQKPTSSLSIGVVNINSIEEKSKFFQTFKKKLDALNAKIYKEILEQETKLRARYERLREEEEEGKEPNQEILKLKAEFDKEYAQLETTNQTRREELDQQYTKGLENIKQTLKKIIDDISKTHGLTLVLNKSIGDSNQMSQTVVLFCNQGLDFTEEVIQRLDATLLPKS